MPSYGTRKQSTTCKFEMLELSKNFVLVLKPIFSDDSTLYAIKWPSIKQSSPTEEQILDKNDEALLNPPKLMNTITMTTTHNEKFICELPDEDSKVNTVKEEYTVRLIIELVRKI